MSHEIIYTASGLVPATLRGNRPRETIGVLDGKRIVPEMINDVVILFG